MKLTTSLEEMLSPNHDEMKKKKIVINYIWLAKGDSEIYKNRILGLLNVCANRMAKTKKLLTGLDWPVIAQQCKLNTFLDVANPGQTAQRKVQG